MADPTALDQRVSVLALTAGDAVTPDILSSIELFDRMRPWWDGSLLSPSSSVVDELRAAGIPVRRLGEAGWSPLVDEPSLKHRGRLILARGRGAYQALVSRAPIDLVWSLKSDPKARQQLRQAHVLLALDVASERAARSVPDLVGETRVLYGQACRDWTAAMLGLAAALWSCGPEADLSESGLARLEARVEPLLRGLPEGDVRGGAAAVASVVRDVHRVHRQLAAARVAAVLDSPRWAYPERLDSGLVAQRLSADLTLGLLRANDLRGSEVAKVVSDTLRAADEALREEHFSLALALLADVMGLMFHRARHAEVPRSPLVDDPATFLRPLLSSAIWQAMLPEMRRPTSTKGPDRRKLTPRVVVVTGAYGSFHRGLVKALSTAAEVRVRDFTSRAPSLGRKVMDPDVLPALATWIATKEQRSRLRHDPLTPAEVTDHGLDPLSSMLGWAHIVVSDWADRSTVWISHACPPSVRLVVRVHALDALDPWIHLMRWDRVEKILVVAEPWRSVVTDILTAHGVEIPVVVVPNVIAVSRMDRPKRPEARRTLGLVGWGRRVKDPAWALDLLEREPCWRLVLIGAPFPSRPAPHTAAYVEAFQERLRSMSMRDRVVVVGQTDDVGAALRDVGVILSTSVREGAPLGVVEGAASGAIPVVRDWPLLRGRATGGARAVFPPEWVVDDLDGAETRVRAITAPGVWEETSLVAREQARQLFDPDRVEQRYRDVVLGEVRS